MIIDWNYGAIDGYQFGESAWNWSTAELIRLGRIEFTMANSRLEFGVEGRLEFTAPNERMEVSIEQSQIGFTLPNLRPEFTAKEP